MTATQTSLPTIARFDGVMDSGEFGAVNCPHCDAKGRYIYKFTTTDGRHLGAMAGCVKLYPVSPIAGEQKALMDKLKAKGELNSWDLDKQLTIDQFYRGDIDEDLALRAIRDINKKRDAWIARKYRGRR
jgi:hypothetical protein